MPGADGPEVDPPSTARTGSTAAATRTAADGLEESIASVARATDPVTDDPFVELDLVDSQRWVAPGGWRRAVIGVGVGLVAGIGIVVANRADAVAAHGGADQGVAS